MQKLLIATTNQGKLKELSDFLSDLPLELVSLFDVGITDEVEEDGITYEENSQKKALFYAKKSGLPAVADDGGIEISALNGEPGINSRRWLGHESTDEELIEHMSQVSKDLLKENRDAYFKVVLTLALPTGEVFSVGGGVKGVIAKEPHPKLLKGYPFRSFFFLPEINKFYHDDMLSEEEKKKYNHRYRAIQKLKPILRKELSLG